jgi:hypothetical protein
LCLAASGGGAYAAASKLGGDGLAIVQNNPTYVPSDMTRANPLHKQY